MPAARIRKFRTSSSDPTASSTASSVSPGRPRPRPRPPARRRRSRTSCARACRAAAGAGRVIRLPTMLEPPAERAHGGVGHGQLEPAQQAGAQCLGGAQPVAGGHERRRLRRCRTRCARARSRAAESSLSVGWSWAAGTRSSKNPLLKPSSPWVKEDWSTKPLRRSAVRKIASAMLVEARRDRTASVSCGASARSGGRWRPGPHRRRRRRAARWRAQRSSSPARLRSGAAAPSAAEALLERRAGVVEVASAGVLAVAASRTSERRPRAPAARLRRPPRPPRAERRSTAAGGAFAWAGSRAACAAPCRPRTPDPAWAGSPRARPQASSSHSFLSFSSVRCRRVPAFDAEMPSTRPISSLERPPANLSATSSRSRGASRPSAARTAWRRSAPSTARRGPPRARPRDRSRARRAACVAAARRARRCARSRRAMPPRSRARHGSFGACGMRARTPGR